MVGRSNGLNFNHALASEYSLARGIASRVNRYDPDVRPNTRRFLNMLRSAIVLLRVIPATPMKLASSKSLSEMSFRLQKGIGTRLAADGLLCHVGQVCHLIPVGEGAEG